VHKNTFSSFLNSLENSMRGLEHVLFSFLFAGELYAYIRTHSLLFFIRGGKFFMHGLEHILFFF
jgi:hypothetical protein